MTTINIQLPEALRQRAESIASERGSTIDDLVQELLEEYLAHNDQPSLEKVVAKIKATPPNPSNFHPATQSLAELLTASPQDPSFDLEVWNREWAVAEREMKTITHENDRVEGRI
jgi:hypothetical protein